MATQAKEVDVRVCDRCGKEIKRRAVIDTNAARIYMAVSGKDDCDLCGACERSVAALGARILTPKARKE